MSKGTILYVGNYELPDKNAAAHRVMANGKIQQIGTPTDVYNEPVNAFVADFIGESNIIDGIMLKDCLVQFDGCEFTCVDKGFPANEEVDVVLRPEELRLAGEVLLRDLAGEPVVERHVAMLRIPDRIAEEDPLIAPAVRVNPLRDVRGLPRDMDRHHDVIRRDRALRPEEILVLPRVADLPDRLADEFAELVVGEPGRGRHLARQRRMAVLELALEGHAGLRIDLEVAVEDEGDDEIAHAVGMSRRAPFACSCHVALSTPLAIPQDPRGVQL